MAFKIMLFVINFSFLIFFPFSVLTLLFALSTLLMGISIALHKEMAANSITTIKNIDTERR